MEQKNKIYTNFISKNSTPLIMREFSIENNKLIFTEEDIKNAESEGYTKGFNEGIELGVSQGELKATREIDTIVQKALLEIESSLKEIIKIEKVFSANFFSSILRVCSAVLSKSMPFFFKKHGQKEMKKFLKEIVESLVIHMPIQVKVPEFIYEETLEHLKNLCSTYPETINLIKTNELIDNTCEIEWNGGGAQWNLETRYQEIELKMQEYLNTYVEQGEHHG